MTETGLVIGFDCGGSTTRAAIATADGVILGQGWAGPSNYLVTGVAATMAALHRARSAALSAARLSDCRFSAAALTMAGVGLGSEHPSLAPVVQSLPTGRVTLVGDMVGAFVGALPDRIGIVVIAGTGSIAFGMNAPGVSIQVGGWGHLLGDEGSGYSIGLAALRAITHMADGRQVSTGLSARILAALNLPRIDQLIEPVYLKPLGRHEIAALAPLVLEAAEEDDHAARAIVRQAADDLALTASTTLRRLELADTPVRVACSGGLFRTPSLRAAFEQSLHDRRPRAEIVRPELPPLGGAIILALEKAGRGIDATIRANLAAGLAE